MAEDLDPSAIRSLAVSTEDVVNAFVYGRENPGTAVLRVTPPYHGRMRARLHVYRVEEGREPGEIHVPPADLLADGVVSDYPAVERVVSRLPTDDPSPETIREARAEVLESWRDRAATELEDEVVLETDFGRTRVDVKRLG